MALESVFEHDFLEKVEEQNPDCIILKNYSAYCQGIPDRTILFGNGRYALLELKRGASAARQPNQAFYIHHVNAHGGYARFVSPENAEQVLRELQQISQS